MSKIQISIEQRKVMTDAVKTFGLQTQFIVLREEAAEFIQALTKLQRFGTNENYIVRNLIEESVDLLIMTEEMKQLFEEDLPGASEDEEMNINSFILEASTLIQQSIIFEFTENHEGSFLQKCVKTSRNLQEKMFGVILQNQDIQTIFDAKIDRLRKRIRNIKGVNND